MPEPVRILIEQVRPSVDDGRYPIKREAGDSVEVTADVFRDGHDQIVVWLLDRKVGAKEWHRSPMRCINAGLDVWQGRFTVVEIGAHEYAIEASCDLFGSWASDTRKKVEAKVDFASDLLEGIVLAKRFLKWLPKLEQPVVREAIKTAEASKSDEARAAILLAPGLVELLSRNPDPATRVLSDRVYPLWVDRITARFASWYECFPRSCTFEAGKSGTFKDVEARLPEIKAMGFDVLYFPPIHPIGFTNRKGPNNSLTCKAGDPGCPYSIGGPKGGHDAVEPSLGTMKDFEHLVKAAQGHGLEIALDFAINCSPDHPYLKEHREWFSIRPDGSIKYAENPPKKYEDIYPINFESTDREGLWEELKRIFLYWAKKGVRIFRVDNPHTKPFNFWQWVIADVQAEYPDTIFLAEAFTRPKVMKALAKLGFTQSYSYFTWRNFKQEIVEYFTELTTYPVAEYMRVNLFVNTPDIFPTFLQKGGRAAYKIRAALAATLSSVYGIFQGFELCEGEPVPNKEEYLNSDKYEIRFRDWNKPGNIKAMITRLNRIRNENPALQEYDNLRFYRAENEHILFYGKSLGDNHVLVAVNLDPFQRHNSFVYVPIERYGIKPDETYQVHDVLTDKRYLWKGEKNYIDLDPAGEPANVFVLRKWTAREQDFDYYK
ncbi:MAG TPA: alpha-1,4-glucan--maltose-1-phosphate maltosyltransferase [Candidatus Ozemobacteraceae bacterium]|nr:alpha-1,4-glucan--maltose-1-phosphate maltosyltransferase [Candidatus Ozemobacteraceae bacterium]